MKLREYLGQLAKLVKETPNIMDMEVITSADDEGNDFVPVVYGAAVGKYEDREFDGQDKANANAVCLN